MLGEITGETTKHILRSPCTQHMHGTMSVVDYHISEKIQAEVVCCTYFAQCPLRSLKIKKTRKLDYTL